MCLKDKKSYGKLAKKYKYGYMYNFFSGDIHLLSQIDKLIPFNTNHSKQYYDIYLNCILTLLKDYFLLINDYNTEVKVDVTKLNQINFIEIDTFNKLGYKAKINTHTTSYIN